MAFYIWFPALGLLFGWCVMLMTAGNGYHMRVRGVVMAGVCLAVGIAFDVIAFEADHLAVAAVGSLVGAVIAYASYLRFGIGLEQGIRKSN